MFASVLIWQPFSIFGVEFRFVELERRIMIRRWRRFFRVRLRTIRGACDRRARVAPEKRISANPGQNLLRLNVPQTLSQERLLSFHAGEESGQLFRRGVEDAAAAALRFRNSLLASIISVRFAPGKPDNAPSGRSPKSLNKGVFV